MYNEQNMHSIQMILQMKISRRKIWCFYVLCTSDKLWNLKNLFIYET